MDVTIEKMSPERADDFVRFFEEIAFADHMEWGRECYCCFFHAQSEQEWHDRTAEENRDIARAMIRDGSMLGLLAYKGSIPVGWCHYEWKNHLPGLKVFFPKVYTEDENDSLGSIVCFTIAQGYRKQGIASRLLDAACRELAALGCQVAEAYPSLGQSDEDNYLGPLAMYLAHGFYLHRETEGQIVVRKKLL
jgi:GNAT superfamily N-acetyltransferase